RSRQGRDVPRRLDVAEPFGDQDKIDRAFADDLVRNMDVAGLRVLRFGNLVHGAFMIAPDPAGATSSVGQPSTTGRADATSSRRAATTCLSDWNPCVCARGDRGRPVGLRVELLASVAR